MAKTIVVEQLKFMFDDTWTVEKYDDHAVYRKKIARLDSTKAVDLVAVRQKDESQLFFIEVKDFRDHRIENKDRLNFGEIGVELAQKVRDTIAGLVGANRVADNRHPWKTFVNCLTDWEIRLKVVLWLEQDLPLTQRERDASRNNTLGRQIKSELRWLTTHVIVANQNCPNELPGVEVSSMPNNAK